MMKTLILLFLSLPAWATSYTLSTSGSVWGARSIWTPTGVPGDGDTVNIPDGMTVWVQDAEVVGSSGANGTVAIILTMIQWVRAGYSPTNSLLAGSAHDGTDIGAVLVSFSTVPKTQGGRRVGNKVKGIIR
jgi:hypothetical protein